MRIKPGLPGLAQVACRKRRSSVIVDRLATSLLDEHSVDSGLTRRGGDILAGPAVASEACDNEILKEIGFVAILAVVARITDDPEALHYTIGAYQERSDNRKAIRLGA